MKIKTEILEAETHTATGELKKTVAGKQFARFKTSNGWAGCFNAKDIDTLKAIVGHEVVLEIEESADGKFKTIKGIYPDGTQEEEDTFTDAVKRTDAQEKGNPKNYSGKSGGKDATFYTSYAKDIVVALIQHVKTPETLDLSLCMAQATDAVNNAKCIFEGQ